MIRYKDEFADIINTHLYFTHAKWLMSNYMSLKRSGIGKGRFCYNYDNNIVKTNRGKNFFFEISCYFSDVFFYLKICRV